MTNPAVRVREFLSFYRLSTVYACICLTVIGGLVARAPDRNADEAEKRGITTCTTVTTTK